MKTKPRIHQPAPPVPPQPHNWLNDLLTPEAVLGLCALFVQPLLLALRAREFAEGLVLTSLNNDVFFTVPGIGFPITNCQALGIALTLIQMISASVAITEAPPDSARTPCLTVLATGVLAVTSALELGLLALMAHSPIQTALFVCVGLAVALGESFAGILIFDHLLIPAMLAFATAVRETLRRPRAGGKP